MQYIFIFGVINFIILSGLIVKVPAAVTFAQRTCWARHVAMKRTAQYLPQNLSVGRINCIHNFNDHIVFKLLYCMSEVHLYTVIHTHTLYILHAIFESDFKVNIMNITFFVKWKFCKHSLFILVNVFVYYCEHEMANILCNLCCLVSILK